MIKPEALRYARERLGYSYEEVSRLTVVVPYGCPVSVDELVRWEMGEMDDETLESPTLCQLETLAEVYHCPVGWFFAGVPESEMKQGGSIWRVGGGAGT